MVAQVVQLQAHRVPRLKPLWPFPPALNVLSQSVCPEMDTGSSQVEQGGGGPLGPVGRRQLLSGPSARFQLGTWSW